MAKWKLRGRQIGSDEPEAMGDVERRMRELGKAIEQNATGETRRALARHLMTGMPG